MRRTSLFLLAVLLAAPARAQRPPDAGASPAGSLVRLPLPGDAAADRLRLRGLTGRDPLPFGLLRAPSSDLSAASTRLGLLAPELRTVVNTTIPLSLNDGAMWAGRGVTVQAMGGAFARVGPLTVVLAPQLVWTQNLDFETLSTGDPGRSRMLPPWRAGDSSADLPLRFGEQAFSLIDPGQSSIRLDLGPVALGAASESQWWGPGIRNAIVLSNNAGGIPHAYLHARGTPSGALGRLEAKWVVGGLTESLYFDDEADNAIRSFSAAAATWSPGFDPGLTVGLARAVYAPVSGAGAVADHAADVFTRWRRPDPDEPGEAYEQITSLFGRWVFPAPGLEVYGEWARNRIPSNVRDFLVAPNHTQGYTLGLQWARERDEAGDLLRVQTEVSFLERSPTYRLRETPGYYVSSRIPQGYTHRGQVIGAAIGPGASSQWVAVDRVKGERSVGGYAMRIRWDNDAFYSRPNGDRWYGHDLSLLLGLRGTTVWRGAEIGADLALEERLNYLYQNPSYFWGDEFATDVTNLHLRLTLTPRR